MRLLFPFLMLLVTGRAAEAGTASLLALTQFCSESPELNSLPCAQTSQSNPSGTAQANGGQTFTAHGAFDGLATATSAAYVLFSGSSSLTVASYEPNSYLLPGANILPFAAGAFSDALDYLTVTGGSGSGLLRFFYDTESTQDNGGSSLPGVIYNVMAIQGAGQRLQEGKSTMQLDVPFDFDTELELNFALYNAFNFYDNDPAFQPNYSYSGSMSSTVRLRGTSVLDSDGNPILGATISAASGTDYATGAATSATPEPGTWWLTGISGTGLVIQALRKPLRRSALQRD